MARQKVTLRPRSPTTDNVFEAFIGQLRAEPLIDEAAADRLQAVLSPGQTINAPNLQEALFPAQETTTE